MNKFGFRWIKRWVRSRSSPIPLEKAEVWERRFAFAYFFAAWNLLAYLGYNYYKNKNMGSKFIEDGETLAEKMVRRANMQNVTIYRMNNLSYEGKRTVDSVELAEKHQQKIDELQES
ncbi:hypothetical protein GHT06_001558 [Daphnia sinensis]|uniref:Uncharacterized protein n=1 Tax=Daphnia sinensis TaxID=1820382 RepID=A0AAD5KU41_9CRUS|nr:hypothetical protein GHT06_004545 [Daphnia sinensis]KAI9551292.1 hypothetical protein GHT06_001558 [Daphnia sinensis]